MGSEEAPKRQQQRRRRLRSCLSTLGMLLALFTAAIGLLPTLRFLAAAIPEMPDDHVTAPPLPKELGAAAASASSGAHPVRSTSARARVPSSAAAAPSHTNPNNSGENNRGADNRGGFLSRFFHTLLSWWDRGTRAPTVEQYRNFCNSSMPMEQLLTNSYIYMFPWLQHGQLLKGRTD